MKRTATAFLFSLLLTTSALAGPIGGSWVPAPAPSNSGDTPYSNTSADCHECNIGYLLGPITGLEWLPGGFGYDGWEGASRIGGLSEWTDSTLSYDGLSWTYAVKGFAYNSWQGTNLFLFRQATPTYITYWLTGEHQPYGSPDGTDGNDDIYSWTVPLSSAPPPSCANPNDCRPPRPDPCSINPNDCRPPNTPPLEEPPIQTPEPATVLLALPAIVVLVRRRR